MSFKMAPAKKFFVNNMNDKSWNLLKYSFVTA